MPGIKGAEKIEIRPGEARAEEIVEIDRQVDPFVHPTLIETPGNRSSYEGAKSDGLKDFLAIGEKGTFPAEPTVAATLRVAQAGLRPAATTERGLLAGLVNFFRITVPEFFSNLPIAPVGPMMIFSFILFPARDFIKEIERLNEKLVEYDKIASREEAGIPLTPAELEIYDNEALNILAEKRISLVLEYKHHLQASQNHPQILARKEIQRILVEENMDSPLGAVKYLAQNKGVSGVFYAGRLLQEAKSKEVEAWLEHWKSLYPADKKNNFPYHAVAWIKEHGLRGGIPALRKFLKHPEAQVRIVAAEALLELGESRKALKTLIKFLYKPEKEMERELAEEVLLKYGNIKLARHFLWILGHPGISHESRVMAAELLGRWEIQGAREGLKKLFLEIRMEFENRDPENSYFDLHQLLRVAKALRQLKISVDVQAETAWVFRNFRSDDVPYNSLILEELPMLYQEVEGARAVPSLKSFLIYPGFSPELRSGAALALGRTGLPEAREALWECLRNRKNSEAFRSAALEALIKFKDLSENEKESLKPVAYELTNGSELFIRKRALEALVALGEGSNAARVILSMLSIPPDVMQQLGYAYLEDMLPYAHHEISASEYFESWVVKIMEKIDPQWDEKLIPGDREKIFPLIREEWKNLVQKKDQEDFYSLDPSLQGSVGMIGNSLTEAILAGTPNFGPDTPTPTLHDQFRRMKSDTVAAIAWAAKTNLRSIFALLILHRNGNSHAREALLNLDIGAYLKAPSPNFHIVEALRELGEVGHTEAEAAYKKWRN